MSRTITATVLIMLLLLNGTVTVMSGAGLSDDLGVQLAPGVDNAMDNVVDNAEQGFDASSGTTQTLFALFAAAMGTFNVLINGVFAAPQMFVNLGFPSWFVLPVFAPMYIVATLELIFMASGRDAI